MTITDLINSKQNIKKLKPEAVIYNVDCNKVTRNACVKLLGNLNERI